MSNCRFGALILTHLAVARPLLAELRSVRVDMTEPGTLARRVISRSNMKPTGRFPSFRMGCMLAWESAAELNFMRLMDCDARVIEMREQPCTVYYQIEGIDHRHYPDVLVRTSLGTTLWEVKTRADAASDEVAARSRLLSAALPALGYQYCVAMAEDLRREPRLRNVRRLLRQGRGALSLQQREHCRRLLDGDRMIIWRDVEAGKHGPLTLQAACRLVLEGLVNVDVNHELASQVLRPTLVLPQAGAGDE